MSRLPGGRAISWTFVVGGVLLAVAGAAQAWGPITDNYYEARDNFAGAGGPTNVWSTYSGMSGWTCPASLQNSNDALSANVWPSGFSFDFYGISPSNLKIDNNGYITFSNPSSHDWSPDQIPDTFDPDQLVAIHWHDMDASATAATDKVCYQLLSGSPRIFAVRFKELPDWTTPANRANAVILLYETRDVVEIHYGTTTSDGNTAQGIEGTGAAGQGISYGWTNAETDRTTHAVQFRGKQNGTGDTGSRLVEIYPYANADAYRLDYTSNGTTLVVADGCPGTGGTNDTHRDVLCNDSPVGNVAITAMLVSPPAAGSLSLAPNGSFTFTPPAVEPCGPSGTSRDYTFTYLADDPWPRDWSSPYSDRATVTITVVNCNQFPVASDGATATNEDTAVAIALAATDGDGHPLWYNVTVPPLFGTLTPPPSGFQATPPTLTYTPNAQTYNKLGTRLDTFTFRVEDPQGGWDTAVVTVDTKPVNDPPGVTLADVATLEDESASIAAATYAPVRRGAADPVANQFDEQNQTLTLSVQGACDTTLFLACPAVAGGALKYTPHASKHGSASVTIRLADDGSHQYTGPAAPPPASPLYVEASLTIVVRPVNDPPILTLAIANFASDEDTAASIPAATWLTSAVPGPPEATDEADQVLSFSIVSTCDPAFFESCPALGAGNAIAYAPKANVFGSATVTVRLSDDGTDDHDAPAVRWAEKSFVIDVLPVNDAPTVALGVAPTVDEDSASSGQPANTHAYPGWATLTVGPPNEEASGQTLARIDAVPSNPGLFSQAPSIATDGTLTFVLAAHQVGSSTITVTVHDSGPHGGTHVNRTTVAFSIVVTPVNDPPELTLALANHVSDEDVGVAIPAATWLAATAPGPAAATDEAGQVLALSIVSSCDTAFFAACPALTGGNGITFAPAADVFGDRAVTIRLSDDGTNNGPIDNVRWDEKTFVLQVLPRNDPPTVVLGPAVAVDEDSNSPGQPAGAHVLANWATFGVGPPNEASQAIVRATTSATNPGLFAIAPALNVSGTLRFTLAQDARGASTVTLTVFDNGPHGGLDQNSTTVTFPIAVANVNDAPIAVDDDLDSLGMEITSGQPDQLLPLLANDTDADGQVLTVHATTLDPAHGTAVATAGGVLFTPTSGYTGPVSFQYQARDPDGAVSNWANVAFTLLRPLFPVVQLLFADNPCAGDTWTLTTSSVALHRTTVAWRLDAGDGRILGSSAPGDTWPLDLAYPTPGTYVLNLTTDLARNDDAADIVQGWAQRMLTVRQCLVPTADFTFAIQGLAVTFTDATVDPDGVIVSWSWDFGDGNMGSGAAPLHTYVTPGTYTVRLAVVDDQARQASVQQTFELTVPANLHFVRGRCMGDTFDMAIAASAVGRTATAWRIATGDGRLVSSGQVGSPLALPIVYPAAGTFTVAVEVDLSLDADPGNLARARVQRPLTVLECNPPAAAFQLAIDGLGVAFTDASTDPDDSIVAWSWAFGDGGDATQPSPQHAYATPGQYVVTLTVQDAQNRTASTSRAFELTVPASLTFLDGRCAGESFQMLVAASAVGRSAASLQLDTGDGRQLSWPMSGSPLHIAVSYAVAGSYAVSIEVALPMDGNPGNAARALATRQLNVGACQAPSPSFSFAIDGLSVAFADASTDSDGVVAGWTWDFGDGLSSTAQHPTHTYVTPGTYVALLVARDDHNLTAGTTHSFELTVPATIEFVSGRCAGDAFMIRVGATAVGRQGTAWRLAVNGVALGSGVDGAFVDLHVELPAPGTYDVVAEADLALLGNPTNLARAHASRTGANGLAAIACVAPVAAMTASLDGWHATFADAGSHDPDGTVTAWRWDFGDGVSSLGPTASHVYRLGGTYTARLTVTDDHNRTATTSQVLVVTIPAGPAPPHVFGGSPAGPTTPAAGTPPQGTNRPPVAVARAQSGRAGEPLVLDGASSHDPDGDWLRARWTQVSGPTAQLLEADAIVARFMAVQPGNYTFRLVVDDGHASSTAETQATVATHAAGFSPQASGARSFVFSGAPPADAYHWDFGDGTTGTGREPRHEYLHPGTYTVVLRMVDGSGTVETTRVVTVTADAQAPATPPRPDRAFEPAPVAQASRAGPVPVWLVVWGAAGVGALGVAGTVVHVVRRP